MSDIEFESINENFPIAGQDNDTQPFRDNFEAIKTGLRVASEEIEELQDNTARTDQNTDFNGFGIENAVLNRTFWSAWSYGERDGVVEIDFQNGHYQILNITDTSTVTLTNFPAQPFVEVEDEALNFRGVAGKIRLEIRNAGDSSTYSLDFSTSGSGATTFRKNFAEPLTIGEDPLIFEIWRHSQDEIFIRSLGEFVI